MTKYRLESVKNHHKTVLKQIKDLCCDDKHGDIVFFCDGDNKRVIGHSVLMKNISKLVLQSLQLSLLQEKIVIILENVNSQTVENLLQFLYAGEVTVSEENAENLHDLCQMLEIDFGQDVVSVRTKPRGARKRSLSGQKLVEKSPKRMKSNQNTHQNNNVPACNRDSSHPNNQIKLNSTKPTNSSKILLEKKRGRPTEQVISQDNDSNSNSIFASDSNETQISADPMLYCYCRKPSSKDLIGCDYCPQWYHPTCLQLSDESLQIILNLPSWRCPECEKIQETNRLKHQQMQLPIPQAARFCEVKTTRLESWGLNDYRSCGWVPLTSDLWVPLSTSTSSKSSEVDNFKVHTEVEHKNRRRHRKSVIPYDPSQYEYISKLGKSSLKSKDPSCKKPEKSKGTINDTFEDVVIMEKTENTIESQEIVQHESVTRVMSVERVDHSSDIDITDSQDEHHYDELFFCYSCKSIFVSKHALDKHQSYSRCS